MEKKKFYVARDEDGGLFLYLTPKEYLHKWEDDEGGGTGYWAYDYNDELIKLPSNLFPNVKWSDEEPTEVELTIKNKENVDD